MAATLIALTFFLLITTLTSSTITTNDTAALALFRSQTDRHGNLLANWTRGNACSSSWYGVKCGASGRVIALSLPSLDLRGPLDSLAHLDQLRLLNLHDNRLNGSLLPITKYCTNLKLLYLSKNELSGEIPPEIGSLKRLARLDLSNNNLNGSIPREVSKLHRLATARLQDNVLTGLVPNELLSMPKLKELNLSNNKLYGKVPQGLQRVFGVGSLVGNAGLCGSKPWPNCSISSTPSPLPSSSSSSSSQGSSPDESVVPSNPSSLPMTTLPGRVGGSSPPLTTYGSRGKLSTGAIVGIVCGNIAAVVLIGAIVMTCMCRRRRRSRESYNINWGGEEENESNKGSKEESSEDRRSKLVFFDKTKAFELEELLRASAEMLGKGNLGTVYKAMLENGSSFAVKRLKEANTCSKKEFENCMDLIWKLKHPNIVSLRAYYYAKEEKLLVYDYLHNGSLHSLLHGNRGPGRIPLDWTTRLSIVLGAAQGLSKIHDQMIDNTNLPHGNLKSSNVLVDKDGVACISDFGLALLLSPIQTTARLGGYRAPEQAQTRKLSIKSDVYSFGVLLLEVLTGRAPTLNFPPPSANVRDDEEQGVDLPRWVRSVVRDEWTAEVFDTELLRYKNIEEEMVALLHVALACAAEQPEKRPSMGEVVKMVEEIRVVQSPLGDEFDGSSNSTRSPSLAVTEDSRVSS
ncbi:hypothetical protein Scep_015358 [Stephania cephalantha]|uniref:Protein kinase domain-containing protein n=1 Tax=Stephania cephalantha TaxID=152367 RepID=A0AAP0J560_9MAGN